MTLTEPVLRDALMPQSKKSDKEPDTQTVRIARHAAKKLQTIAALKSEMEESFKPIDFLNGLVVSQIEALYEATMKAFHDWQAKQLKQAKEAKKK